MNNFVEVTLHHLMEIAESGTGYYVGGTNNVTIKDETFPTTTDKVYFAETYNVNYDENRLLLSKSAKNNLKRVSFCEPEPGIVYVVVNEPAGQVVEIGPLNPETFDLYGHEFTHLGKKYKSFLHFVCNKEEELEKLFENHDFDAMKAVRFGTFFGLYVFQHRARLDHALVKYPKGTRFFIQGKTTAPETEICLLKEFVDSL